MMLAVGGGPVNCQAAPLADSTGPPEAVEIDDASGFHKRIRAEIKAGRIHQHDHAIGLQAAVNLRRAVAADGIPDNRTARRLLKNGGFTGGDVEALPVELRVIGRRDRQRRTAGDRAWPNRWQPSCRWDWPEYAKRRSQPQQRADSNQSRMEDLYFQNWPPMEKYARISPALCWALSNNGHATVRRASNVVIDVGRKPKARAPKPETSDRCRWRFEQKSAGRNR